MSFLSEQVNNDHWRSDEKTTLVNHERPFWRSPGNVTQFSFAVAVLLVCAVGGSPILNYVFTPASLFLGLYLFIASSTHYLCFCMWLWMLTPLVRRLVDVDAGFHEQSMVMLAPLLVSLISLFSVAKSLQHVGRRIYAPYFVIISTLFAGFMLGMLQGSASASLFGFVQWLAPIALAMHILRFPDISSENAQAIFKAMAYGTLVMGAYGLFQFFSLPSWDLYWAEQSEMASLGVAAANEIRIFSTMNSPGVFAFGEMAGLITLFAARTRIRPFAAVLGVAALMLSLVRSIWGATIVAFIFIIFKASIKKKMQYLLLSLPLLLLTIPILAIGPIADKVHARLQTLSDTENDTSFKARVDLYNEMTSKLISTPVGSGLGQTGVAARLADGSETISFDSGILDVLLTFGVFGVFIFLSIFMIAIDAVRSARYGPYANVAAGIALASLTQLIFTNMLYAPVGVFFYVFAALATANGSKEKSAPSLTE